MEEIAQFYPEEFDTKKFLELVRKRFGMPIMPEEELLMRFSEFIKPKWTEDNMPEEEDLLNWYKELRNELEQAKRPLDSSLSNISDPHSGKRPTLEGRLRQQTGEVSLAQSALEEQHVPKKTSEKPQKPRLGEE